MKKYKLGEIATVEISGVDKKIKDGEVPVKLCNFVDVYYNWAITSDMEQKFMEATARTNDSSNCCFLTCRNTDSYRFLFFFFFLIP